MPSGAFGELGGGDLFESDESEAESAPSEASDSEKVTTSTKRRAQAKRVMLGCFTHHADSIQAQMLAEHTVKEGILRDFDGVKVKRVNAKETLQCLLQNYGGNAEVLEQYPLGAKVNDICRSMQTTGCSHAGFTLALAARLAQVWRYDCGGEGIYKKREQRHLDAHALTMQLAIDISALTPHVVFKCLLDLTNMPVRKIGILQAYTTAKQHREASKPRTSPAFKRRYTSRRSSTTTPGICYRFNDNGICDRNPCRWLHNCKFCNSPSHGAFACTQRRQS